MNTAAAPVAPAAPALSPAFTPLPSTTGGWHDSSMDLLLGLEVRDLGPVEWPDTLALDQLPN